MNTYTMEQWRADGTFQAEPGQEITQEIYEEMLNCMPPGSLPRETTRQAMDKYSIPVNAGFLMGEPYTSDSKGNNLFYAFGMARREKTEHYYYLGLSKAARALHGVYYYMDCMNAITKGLYPAADFHDDAEAIQKAADYEATLYRYEYRNGEQISRATLYEPRLY